MTAPLVPGPPAVEPAARPIQLKVYESDNVTHVADLATDITGTRRFTPELPGIGQFGTGSFDIPLYVNDDGAMIPNPEVALLTRGRIVRFYLNGTCRLATVIRPRRQTSVSTEGHAGLVRSMRMRGIMSEWDRAVMPVAPGAEKFKGGTERHFGWMSREADIYDLDDAVILRPVFQDGKTHPEPWLDLYGSVFDASTHRYFVFDQEVEADMSVSVHQAFGDTGRVWVGSVPMGSGADAPDSSWNETLHGGARLTANTIRWGFEVQGLPDAAEPRWTATCYEINDATTGQMNGDTILWRTGYITGTTPYPWKASATAQGPTAKQIIRSVLGQVQFQQEKLLDWDLDGDDDMIDANGEPLDRIPHVPFAIGCKLGTDFLLGLARSFVDLRASDEGKLLKVYRWRERGNYHEGASGPIFSDAIFSPAAGRLPNVNDMTHEERIQ